MTLPQCQKTLFGQHYHEIQAEPIEMNPYKVTEKQLKLFLSLLLNIKFPELPTLEMQF